MIKLLSTDQHIQIRLYMAKKPSDILQLFDVYREKYKKALFKIIKSKGCEKLRMWIKAEIDHFCLCVSCDVRSYKG